MSCAPSPPSAPALPQISRAPDVLTMPCRDPENLTRRGALPAGDTARLWGADRRSLVECAGRHSALSRHVRGQERAQERALPRR